MADREAELLSVPYYHIVFTLLGPIADLAYQNKEVMYDILFKASAETIDAAKGSLITDWGQVVKLRFFMQRRCGV